MLALALLAFAAPLQAQDAKNCGMPTDIGDGWTLASPADVGMDTERLCGLDKLIAQWPDANIHAVVIVRHGKLVMERYFAGADQHWGMPLGKVDYAADVRAPTPTGAAEIAVPVRADLEATLAGLGARLERCTSRHLERKRTALAAAARVLPSPDQLFALPRRHFDEAATRLDRSLVVNLDRKRSRFAGVRLTPASLAQRLGEARRHLTTCGARLDSGLRSAARDRRSRFERIGSRLSVEPLRRRASLAGERLAALMRRKDQLISIRLERVSGRLAQADRLLNTLSHQAILARGFALVMDADGNLLRRAAEVADGAALTIRFADGDRDAVAGSGGPRPQKTKTPEKKPTPTGSQGSLF